MVGLEGDLEVEGFSEFHCPFCCGGYEAVDLEL